MTRSIAAALGATIGWAQLLAAQGLGSITGTVRDPAGVPLGGAEVALDTSRVTTNPQGGFRFDSLRAGLRFITIRLVGYSTLRARLTVQGGVAHHDFVLQPSIPTLPPVVVTARRTGIYGTVGDSAFAPMPGVTLLVAGNRGGTAVTDSSGRFGMPRADAGQYVVSIAHPGYAEERLFVEVKKQEGVELAIRLRPSRWPPSRADQVATFDLGRRLAVNLPRERLAARELDRYGSLSLCDVNRIGQSITEFIGRGRPAQADTSLTIIIDGTFVLEKMPVRALCSWKASEVQLVEFMPHVCRDLTRTLVDMLNVWCQDFGGNLQSKKPPPSNPALDVIRDRIRTRNAIPGQEPGGPVVVIWEKR